MALVSISKVEYGLWLGYLKHLETKICVLSRELIIGDASGNGRVRWRRGGEQEKDKAGDRVKEIIRAQVP